LLLQGNSGLKESWDEQKQARNHKHRIAAILMGNMHVASTTYIGATEVINFLTSLPKPTSLYLWLLLPVLQRGNISV